MSETTGFVPDPLDDLLGPSTPPQNGDELRRRLLEQTTRALRGRRRRRALAWAAALAACYVAGLVTMYASMPRRVEVVVRDAAVSPPPAPAPVSSPPEAAPASAVALEWKAFDADKSRSDLYRQAGDRYRREDADPASALRCYGRSLDGTAAKDLAISPDDDYLLMLVKEARQKEKDHAKNGG